MLNEENKVSVSESDTGAKKSKKGSEAKARPAAKTEKKTPAKEEAVMYLGPDIKGIASHGVILSDGCGSLFDDVKEKCPMIHSLCVPLDQAPEKYVEMKTGGAISKRYQAAEKALKQTKKGDDSNEL